MGNSCSCTSSSQKTNNHKKSTKVIFPSGEIKKIDQPIKAAELMLESPNFFLVNSASLQPGRRFSPLNADEDLEMANVYVMFSMKRLNSFITSKDVDAVVVDQRSSSERCDAAQIMPEPLVDDKLGFDDLEEFCSMEFRRRLSMCRSKKPLLETIDEETVCSR